MLYQVGIAVALMGQTVLLGAILWVLIGMRESVDESLSRRDDAEKEKT